jgi:hypothetical protein
MHRFFIISSWTLGVAVAVRAITGILLFILFKIEFKFLYSGLKSCPHSEIQWASSTAKKEMSDSLRKSIYSCLANDSGATYKSFVIPFEISVFTFWISVLFSEEFKT